MHYVLEKEHIDEINQFHIQPPHMKTNAEDLLEDEFVLLTNSS